jgi:hypothetical protein
MAFEKEIKEAKKIADAWLKRSKDDETYFIALKKNGVAWEKENIKRIEAMIAEGELNDAWIAIQDCRKWLKGYESDAETRQKKHFAFVRGNPRDGNKGVCAEMKLDSKDPAYKAVTDSLSKMLMTHTPQFQATESAWKDDLLPRIELLKSKLDSLDKLAKNEEGKNTVYRKQFEKDIAAYKDQMGSGLKALKTETITAVIEKMSKTPDTWLGGDEKFRKDQYILFNNRIAAIEKLLELSDKNYKRVLKNLPDDVKSKTFFIGSLLKSFEQDRVTIDKQLNAALGIFKMAKATFEKNFPTLV